MTPYELEYFLYEKPRDHVARITINRPEVRNAINTPAHKEWSDLLDEAESDDDVWVVVVTGVGDKAFCAGRTKQATMTGLDMALPDAFYHEFPAVQEMGRSDDAREGPLAFAEKRTPEWKGR